MNGPANTHPEGALEGRLRVALRQELDGAPVDAHAVITSTRRRTRRDTVRRRRTALVAVALATTVVGCGTYALLSSQPGGLGVTTNSQPAGRPARTPAPGPFTSWRQEPAPPWTPRTPVPSVSYDTTPSVETSPEPLPPPSPSPPETPRPGDVPSYVVPKSAALTTADVPAQFVLQWDEGPTLHQARVLPTMEYCEYSNMGTEKLGRAPIGGRVWNWAGRGSAGQELVHSVAAFAPGTGHARFEDVKRQRLGEQCDPDADPALISSTTANGEAFILTATVPTGYDPNRQYAAGVARVGDVLVSVQVKMADSRQNVVAAMKDMLNDAVLHLPPAHASK